MIGTVSCTPIRLAPQPHWKTATTTPYAAATPSTLRAAAFNGTSTDRNTTIRTRNDSPITAPRNQGIRCCSREETSTVSAVGAGDRHLYVGPGDRRGDGVGAQVLEQVAGARVLGEVVGVTVMIARSPASLVTGASTEATPAGWPERS